MNLWDVRPILIRLDPNPLVIGSQPSSHPSETEVVRTQKFDKRSFRFALSSRTRALFHIYNVICTWASKRRRINHEYKWRRAWRLFRVYVYVHIPHSICRTSTSWAKSLCMRLFTLYFSFFQHRLFVWCSTATRDAFGISRFRMFSAGVGVAVPWAFVECKWEIHFDYWLIDPLIPGSRGPDSLPRFSLG